MAGPEPSQTLQDRFQRLVLLNRVSVDLFSRPTLAASLEAAGHGMLAVSGAKHLTIFHREDSGRLAPLYSMGPSLLPGGDACALLGELEERTGGLRRTGSVAGESAHWLGVPIFALASSMPSEGLIAAGYPGIAPPPESSALVLEEIARALRNAFLADRRVREQKTLAAVVEQSADPIVLADFQGRITAWSRGAEETFGYPAEQVLGRRLQDFLFPEDQVPRDRMLHGQALKEGSVRGAEATALRLNGTLVPIEMTLTSIRDDQGRPFGMVRVLRDITRRKELERMKSEFVTLVSHELRTPLTSIRGFLEVTLEYWGKVPEAQLRDHLGIALREAKRLSRLAADFLDMSRLDSGAVRLKREPTDLGALAGRVAETLRGYSPTVRIELQIAPDLPRPEADPDELQRVLLNLCGNAIKYSPQDAPITISAAPGEGAVRVSVRDRGPGIPAEQQKRLFERFYRTDDALSQNVQGTGLGLAICKSIVQAHGGRIWVESAPGAGTAVHFELPLPAPAKA